MIENNWERKLQIQNIIVATTLNLISFADAQERMKNIFNNPINKITILN